MIVPSEVTNRVLSLLMNDTVFVNENDSLMRKHDW